MTSGGETIGDTSVGIGLMLSFDADARAIWGRCTPVADAAPVDEAWLIARLAENGWGALRFNTDAAATLLDHYNRGIASEPLRIAEAVDASLAVAISPDFMFAYLNITPAQGGKGIVAEQVAGALEGLGVNAGVDHAAIERLAAAGAASHEVVARGTTPEHGTDGHLESLLPKVRSRAPRVDESGRADYRELGDIFVVHPGDVLMRRIPPTAGVPGRNLQGITLPPAPGRNVVFDSGLSGAAPSRDDPDLLVATIAGQPLEVAGGMIVEPVFTVDNVTVSSGNVHFDGNVVVQGDVTTGMTVQANGDIEVKGVVELASLIAGRNIVVKGGVIGGLGRKGADAHVVRCGGCCEVGYAQNARIEAGDAIAIDDTAIQCELTAGNRILVGKTRHGRLVGGHHQATLNITAKEIGSPQRLATRFEVGVNPAMHKRLLDLAQRRDKFETQLLEVSKLLDLIARNRGKFPPEKAQLAARAAAQLSQQIAELREEQNVLDKKIALSKGARVVALERIYEGVEVHLGTLSFRVPRDFGSAAVALDNDGVLGLVPVEDD